MRTVTLRTSVSLAGLGILLCLAVGTTETGSQNQGATAEKPSYREVDGVLNVRSALDVLFEGEGILDTGKLSQDQQELLFKKDYEGKRYTLTGEIKDIGVSSFGKKKYITVRVAPWNYFDVYPAREFDLMEYRKGTHVTFVGKWTFLGSGSVIHHKIEEAVEK